MLENDDKNYSSVRNLVIRIDDDQFKKQTIICKKSQNEDYYEKIEISYSLVADNDGYILNIETIHNDRYDYMHYINLTDENVSHLQ